MHRLESHTFAPLTFCHVCQAQMWGLFKQGLKCVECSLACHDHCAKDAPACLGLDAVATIDSSPTRLPPNASTQSLSLGLGTGSVTASTGSLGSNLSASASAVASPADGNSAPISTHVTFTIASASSLAKRHLLHTPDPFAVAAIDGRRFKTPVMRKTHAPVWNFSFHCSVNPTSSIVIVVYDNKRLADGQVDAILAGANATAVGSLPAFLGMAVLSMAAFDAAGLARGVQLSFRLKRTHDSEFVTGALVLGARTASDLAKRSSTISIRTKRTSSFASPITSPITSPIASPTDSSPISPGAVAMEAEWQARIAADEAAPLPPGWQEQIDSSGRPFFVNNDTRQVSYSSPSILLASSRDSVAANERNNQLNYQYYALTPPNSGTASRSLIPPVPSAPSTSIVEMPAGDDTSPVRMATVEISWVKPAASKDEIRFVLQCMQLAQTNRRYRAGSVLSTVSDVVDSSDDEDLFAFTAHEANSRDVPGSPAGRAQTLSAGSHLSRQRTLSSTSATQGESPQKSSISGAFVDMYRGAGTVYTAQLALGYEHYFRVRAVNSYGSSDWSISSRPLLLENGSSKALADGESPSADGSSGAHLSPPFFSTNSQEASPVVAFHSNVDGVNAASAGGGSSNHNSNSPRRQPPSSAPLPVTDNRPHCRFFMAGQCVRGSRCPFSHGSGPQTPEDVLVAAMAAVMQSDADTNLAAAIAASLFEYEQHNIEAAASPPDPSPLGQMRRDFNAKQRKIRSSLQASPGECHLKVHRASLFQSSEREVMKRPTKILKKHLFVHFDDEGGLDYGGLAREWIFLLSHEMFNPFYGLFEYSSETNYTLQINPNSITNPDCLRHFEFVGRMVGLATFHRHFIDAAFVSTFYKQLLRRPLQLGDLQHVDPELHRSMIWILENDVTDVIDQTFTVDVDKFGMTVTQELIPNGAQIQVTEDNKKRFVDAMAQWRFFRGTERQMRAFMTGFYEFVPLEEIRHLDESELEFLISGLRQLDIEDWENHTDYTGYDKTDEQVIWFWKCLREMDAEKQAKLLQFVTGTSRVPLEGFRALQGTDRARPFWIQRIHDVSRLPSSHTCFNRLDLPAYSSFEILRSKLLAAVEGSQGFTNE